MTLTGDLLIGAHDVRPDGETFFAFNPSTGEALPTAFAQAGASEVAQACGLAAAAFDIYRSTTAAVRADLLERIAAHIEALGAPLIERAGAESGLPQARLEGERGRTCAQLRLFARVLRENLWQPPVIDTALPTRQPLPRAELRMGHVALGPVAVFGASNFPLAFSVAGGDTASALAAGCPVVVKAHPSHPGTSELVGRAVRQAVADAGLPEGVFSMLAGTTHALGTQLVAHPAIQAVGFTGSRAGGLALLAVAQRRPQPIPVYAEMSAVNPVFMLPGALEARAERLAQGFADSLTLGTGQFCTNPGLVIGIAGPSWERFTAAAQAAVAAKPAGIMLNPGIHRAYLQGVADLSGQPGVQSLARGGEAPAGGNACSAQAAVFQATASTWLGNTALEDEIFGPCALLVRCDSPAQLLAVAERLSGQLTATLHLDEAADADLPLARRLLPVLERKAGRILANAFPTGVEVCHAMVHGGPWPATSDSRSTSVGSSAILRFLRPVCYQDLPQALLPAALRDEATARQWKMVDGEMIAPGLADAAA